MKIKHENQANPAILPTSAKWQGGLFPRGIGKKKYMTNYEPIKEQIWGAVKADDRVEFNKQCEALMNKAAMDIWRMGWSLAPKNIDDVYQMLDELTKWCHERWLEAMKCGDAPAEDVSPGEGFALIKQIIQEAISKAHMQ